MNSFDKTLELLFDETGSLRGLADLTGLEAFSFYHGANLKGLDLTGQDLSGLNFEKADLRGAKLDEIKFDCGAFNGALLSECDGGLKDDYEFYVQDLSSIWRNGLYFYAKFRSSSLESAISRTGLSYESFGKACGINLITLRKARRGQVVSGETATKICEALISAWEIMFKSKHDQQYLFEVVGQASIRQPFIELLSLRGTNGFESVSRQIMVEIMEDDADWLVDLYPPDGRGIRYNFDTMKWFRDVVVASDNDDPTA